MHSLAYTTSNSGALFATAHLAKSRPFCQCSLVTDSFLKVGHAKMDMSVTVLRIYVARVSSL